MDRTRKRSVAQVSIGLKRFIRVLAFLLVFAAILLRVQALLVPNRDWPSNDRRMEKNFAGLLNEQADTMDVYWLGTSHVYEAVSPMEIYRTSGVRSCVVAAPGQRLPTAYYMLKEVMGKQSPAIVALDASALFFTEEENKEKAKWQENIDALPITSVATRVEMTTRLAKLNGEAAYGNEYIRRSLLPILQYHTNYLLEEEDFLNMHKEQLYHRKGYCAKSYIVVPHSNRIEEIETLLAEGGELEEALDPEGELTALVALNRPYLEEMMALCASRGSELVLFKVPTYAKQAYRGHWSYGKSYLVRQLADELGLRYVDLNYEDVGIDWYRDSKDGGMHMNLGGATKVSRFLGEWLNANGGIERAEDAAVKARWDAQLDLYDWEMEYFHLQMVTDLGEYLDRLGEGDYTLLTSVSGSVADFWTDEYQAKFDALTGNTLDLRDGNNRAYCCQSKGGAVVAVAADPSSVELRGEAGSAELKLTSAAGSDPKLGTIRVGGKEMACSGVGIHFVVYDNDLDCPVDSVSFGLDENGALVGTRSSTAFEESFRMGVSARVYDVMKSI